VSSFHFMKEYMVQNTYDIQALALILVPSNSAIGIYVPLLVAVTFIACIRLNGSVILSQKRHKFP